MAWNLDEHDGRLQLETGVEGRAAKMGHRLTLAANRWHARVDWAGDAPAALALTVDLDGVEVVSGEGGVTPMTPPEKALARTNALKVLGAKRFPQIVYQADTITNADGGYRLDGTLTIAGTSRPHTVDLRVDDLGDAWALAARSEVSHRDHKLKPYSMLMGAMRVADAVTVTFAARVAKDR
nr:YceI family protein [Mycolicibacterium flavescens]